MPYTSPREGALCGLPRHSVRRAVVWRQRMAAPAGPTAPVRVSLERAVYGQSPKGALWRGESDLERVVPGAPGLAGGQGRSATRRLREALTSPWRLVTGSAASLFRYSMRLGPGAGPPGWRSIVAISSGRDRGVGSAAASSDRVRPHGRYRRGQLGQGGIPRWAIQKAALTWAPAAASSLSRARRQDITDATAAGWPLAGREFAIMAPSCPGGRLS